MDLESGTGVALAILQDFSVQETTRNECRLNTLPAKT